MNIIWSGSYAEGVADASRYDVGVELASGELLASTERNEGQYQYSGSFWRVSFLPKSLNDRQFVLYLAPSGKYLRCEDGDVGIGAGDGGLFRPDAVLQLLRRRASLVAGDAVRLLAGHAGKAAARPTGGCWPRCGPSPVRTFPPPRSPQRRRRRRPSKPFKRRMRWCRALSC